MTRTSDNRLELSIGNWIAAASAMLSILGSIWGAWGALSTDVAILKTEVRGLTQRLDALDLGPPVPIRPRNRATAAGGPPPHVPIP